MVLKLFIRVTDFERNAEFAEACASENIAFTLPDSTHISCAALD
jgi:hypothetical protein